MEERAPLTALRHRLAAVLVALVLLLGAAGASRADDGELGRAVRTLGAPSLLWGRLAVEEESPEGTWTPLAGVAVTLYPYTAVLAADLERIRAGARASGRDYDAAITRLQERLTAHAADVAALTGTPVPAPARSDQPPPAGRDRTPGPGVQPGGAPGRAGAAERDGASARTATTAEVDTAPSSADGLIRRATTDQAGIFLFAALPAGEWLVVAIQTSAYSATRRPPPSARAPTNPPGRGLDGFLQRERPAAKEAEVWVIRVRVSPDEPARVLLTDRSRFMVGPVR